MQFPKNRERYIFPPSSFSRSPQTNHSIMESSIIREIRRNKRGNDRDYKQEKGNYYFYYLPLLSTKSGTENIRKRQIWLCRCSITLFSQLFHCFFSSLSIWERRRLMSICEQSDRRRDKRLMKLWGWHLTMEGVEPEATTCSVLSIAERQYLCSFFSKAYLHFTQGKVKVCLAAWI